MRVCALIMIRSSLTNNSGEEFSYISTRPIEKGIPTFIFFHATGFNGQTYWQLINGLNEKFGGTINFISIDQRGHGLTKAETGPEEFKDWSFYIKDAVEITDKIEGPLYCAGHSMGAIVAAKLSSLKQSKVKKLIMLEPVLYSPYECFRISFMLMLGLRRKAGLVEQAANRRAKFNSREEMVDSYFGRGVFSTWDRSLIEDYVEGGTRDINEEQVELSCAPSWESRTFMASDMDSWSYLKKLNIPSYILCGDILSTFSSRARKAINRLKGDWRVEVFPKASHSLPMEQIDTLIDRIYQFMSK